MTDKTPLQQLAEWQELSEFFHSLYTKDLKDAENIRRDWERVLESLNRQGK